MPSPRAHSSAVPTQPCGSRNGEGRVGDESSRRGEEECEGRRERPSHFFGSG